MKFPRVFTSQAVMTVANKVIIYIAALLPAKSVRCTPLNVHHLAHFYIYVYNHTMPLALPVAIFHESAVPCWRNTKPPQVGFQSFIFIKLLLKKWLDDWWLPGYLFCHTASGGIH
jgi:hypothetical protein